MVKRRVFRAVKKDWRLYSLLVLPVIYFVIFKYGPMIGNIIAFRRYQPGGSIFGNQWVGLRYFRMFLTDPAFGNVFKNTLLLSTLSLLFGFWPPILFALLLNELRFAKFKKFVQVVSYLPHFLSSAIVCGMVLELLMVNGPINQLTGLFGAAPVSFIQEAKYFRTIYVVSGIWQGLGWGAILYLAALSNIDMQLYEAAHVDGANRFLQTIHITLPGIRPTIIVMLILNVGNLLSVGFEKIILLYNPLIYSTADVISTYLFRMGLESNNYSYATAIGLFESLVGLFLVLTSNWISRRTVDTSIW